MSFRRLALAYILTMAAVFLLGFAFALTRPYVYTTDAMMIAKEQNSNSSLSTFASATKLLGLGSGAAEQNSNFSKFQKYWGSRDVAQNILEKHPGLLRRLFGADWDKANNRWYPGPHNLRQWVAVPLNALFGVWPDYSPTAQDLANVIKNSMKLQVDDLTGKVFVEYKSGDPAFARWFLNTVISETDQAVRAAEQRRDQDFIAFSRSRLEKETNVSYRDALTDSVRQFEINKMYSEAGANFSFQYVEAPYLPTAHSAPRPLLYTVLALIVANLMAACTTCIMWLWPASGFARRMDAAARWLDVRLPQPPPHQQAGERPTS